VWPRLLAAISAALAAAAVYALLVGSLHRLADLWLLERTIGSQPVHTGWFYSQFSGLLTDWITNLPALEPHATLPASPDEVARAGCWLICLGDLCIALPSGSAAWARSFLIVAALGCSVFLVQIAVRSAGGLLSGLAAGPHDATTAWRRIGLLRLTSRITSRACKGLAWLLAPAAGFLAVDRTHDELTGPMGYAVSGRVLVLYWGVVLAAAMLIGTAIAIGWLAVFCRQAFAAPASRCSSCGYPRAALSRCPECGGRGLVARIRPRAVLLSFAMIAATLTSLAIAGHRCSIVLSALVLGRYPHLPGSGTVFLRSAAARQAGYWLRDRLYVPSDLLSAKLQDESTQYYLISGSMTIESSRFLITVGVGEDGALRIRAVDKLDGTTRTEWDAVEDDRRQLIYWLHPPVKDAGLLEICAEQVNQLHADAVGLEAHDRATRVTVIPKDGWRLLPSPNPLDE
jgi:hypothetical protein